MSSNYFTYDSTTLTYETMSNMQFKIYTICVTSQSLICVIIPTVLRASHPLFVWYHTRHRYSNFFHYRRHYMLTLWNQINIFITSHPLYFTLYQCYFCHHIHCIDTTPTVFMRSHPIYVATSYTLYTTTYSLCLYHHSHCTCVSHPLFPWYPALCIYDIAPSICLISDTLYKVSLPKFMSSRHIIYDIICSVYMSSIPRYLTLHPQYLCPHNPSNYDLCTTLCMT